MSVFKATCKKDFEGKADLKKCNELTNADIIRTRLFEKFQAGMPRCPLPCRRRLAYLACAAYGMFPRWLSQLPRCS
eukprot:1169405-Alexandrium_andersonii.AAC.1